MRATVRPYTLKDGQGISISIRPRDRRFSDAEVEEMARMLNVFIQSRPDEFPKTCHLSDEELLAKLNFRVAEFDFSTRASNCLANTGVRFVGELVRRTEVSLLKVRNCGLKTIREYKDTLKDLGLRLAMDEPLVLAWNPPDE